MQAFKSAQKIRPQIYTDQFSNIGSTVLDDISRRDSSTNSRDSVQSYIPSGGTRKAISRKLSKAKFEAD